MSTDSKSRPPPPGPLPGAGAGAGVGAGAGGIDMNDSVPPGALLSRAQVLGGYKRLLRAQQHVFQGDLPILEAAKLETRQQFFSHANETNENTLRHLSGELNAAMEFLTKGLVQGTLNQETDTYTLRMEEQHTLEDSQVPNDIKKA
jgi:hypothetical protein